METGTKINAQNCKLKMKTSLLPGYKFGLNLCEIQLPLRQIGNETNIVNNTDRMVYSPDVVVVKPIQEKSAGHTDVLSFVLSEVLKGKTTTLDIFAQIIEGQAEVIIGGVSYFLMTGDAVVITPCTPDHQTPNGRVDMDTRGMNNTCQ